MAKVRPTVKMDVPQAMAIARRADATPVELATAIGVSAAVDRLLARHANASAELLKSLSRSSDKTTRKCVAIHPNAPKSVLLSLATQFPADFYRNPAFDWLLLEEPDFLFKLGHGVLKNILKRADCPHSFQAWAVEHGDEQEQLAVAMNPEAPEDLLKALAAKGGRPGVAAAAHARLNSSADLGQAERVFLDCVAASLSRLSIHDAKALWRRGCIGPGQWSMLSVDVRLAVPGRDGGFLPAAGFELDDDDDDEDEACDGAPQPDLDTLARDPSKWVRSEVAQSPLASSDVLAALALDPESYVRREVAGNPNASLQTLQSLAKDKDPDVRAASARSGSSSAELLESLSADDAQPGWHEGPVVKIAVAANPGSPRSVLLRLATDKDRRVIAAIAGNTSAPAEVLETLAGVQNRAVRSALAKNPSTPISVLSRLARIKDAKVMQGLEANPACPQSLVQLSAALRWRHDLIKLARTLPAGATDRLPDLPQDDSLVGIFLSECQRVKSSPLQSIVAQLISAGEGQLLALAPENNRSACRSSSEAVRLRGLRHRRADPLVLVKKHLSTDWRERLAIAGNPAAPLTVLQALSRDAHRLVAVQAAATMAIKDEQLKARVAMIAAAPPRPDCRPLAAEVCRRLRELEPSEVGLIGEPWRGRLTFIQRNGEDGRKGLISWLGQEGGIPLSSQDQLRLICALAADPTPSLPWGFLEVPSLVSTAALDILANHSYWSTRGQVAVCRHASGAVLKLLSKDKSRYVRCYVAENPSAPPEALLVLSRQADRDIRYAVARNPSTPLPALKKLAADIDANVYTAVPANEAAPQELRLEVLGRLARNEVPWHRKTAAESPVASSAILQALCLDEEASVRSGVGRNPATPQSVLQVLCADPDTSVRRSVAENPATSPALLEALCRDAQASVRSSAANNPSLPVQLRSAALESLCHDQDDSVRRSAAANTDTPAVALMRLAEDTRAGVREAVAANASTPAETLAALAGDSAPEVVIAVVQNGATSAESRAKALERLASFPGSIGSKVAAGHPATPLPVLHQLAQHEDKSVRLELAANRTAPQELRARLAEGLCRDADLEVRSAVAENEATPVGLLIEMAQMDFWAVRLAAIGNPSFPPYRRQAALDALTEEVRSALEPLPPFAVDDIRLEDFAAPFAVLGLLPQDGDRDAIAKAAKAKDWVQRAAACLSNGITTGELNRLVDDEAELVSQLAISRLSGLQSQSAREVAA